MMVASSGLGDLLRSGRSGEAWYPKRETSKTKRPGIPTPVEEEADEAEWRGRRGWDV